MEGTTIPHDGGGGGLWRGERDGPPKEGPRLLVVFDGPDPPTRQSSKSGFVHMAGPFLMKRTMDCVAAICETTPTDCPGTKKPAKKGRRKNGVATNVESGQQAFEIQGRPDKVNVWCGSKQCPCHGKEGKQEFRLGVR
jgi:hypothetical protein